MIKLYDIVRPDLAQKIYLNICLKFLFKTKTNKEIPFTFVAFIS